MQGVVLVGMGRADVVADVEPSVRAVELGSPAMAVRDSVVDESATEDDDVKVTFCTPGITAAVMLPSGVGGFVEIRLLGRGEEEAAEKLPETHWAVETQAIKKNCIEGIIGADLEM